MLVALMRRLLREAGIPLNNDPENPSGRRLTPREVHEEVLAAHERASARGGQLTSPWVRILLAEGGDVRSVPISGLDVIAARRRRRGYVSDWK